MLLTRVRKQKNKSRKITKAGAQKQNTEHTYKDSTRFRKSYKERKDLAVNQGTEYSTVYLKGTGLGT